MYVIIKKGEIVGTKCVLPFESFDDNKVLKNCQLDMLIFVQVYRTIDKNLRSILGSGRTKESKEINKKEA